MLAGKWQAKLAHEKFLSGAQTQTIDNTKLTLRPVSVCRSIRGRAGKEDTERLEA